MTKTILVTGGTGTLGRHVVPLLLAAGGDVRLLSRKPANEVKGVTDVEYAVGDLATGDGVAEALKGVHTVLHLAGTMKGDGDKARVLVDAAAQAGVRHLVYISVVGADTIPVKSGVDRAMFGYFAEKRAAELVVEESGIPWTTVRATQFHDLLLTMVEGTTKLPVAPAPGFRFQPVDARDVAERLVELTLGEPAGLAEDIAGPRVYPLKDLVRSYLRAAGKRRLIVPMATPGKAAKAYRAGANLSPERATDSPRTWESFLAERVR